MKKCQKFTPLKYVDELLDNANYIGNNILNKKLLETSCGEGNILSQAVKRYIEQAKKAEMTSDEITQHLEKNFIGYEIDHLVAQICIKNLDELALKHNMTNIKWKIYNKDYLEDYSIQNVDFIIGNPPYISYTEIDVSVRIKMKNNFMSCKSGKFDYYYAFIEKGLSELNKNTGIMSIIIPNSIFKIKSAKTLREIILQDLTRIIDYKYSRIFDNALTSPAIIVLNKKTEISTFTYNDYDNNCNLSIEKNRLGDRWIFEREKNNIKKDEKGSTFGDFFIVNNSVATLLNKVFIIPNYNIIKEDDIYIYLADGQRIEKDLLLDGVSPRSISKEQNQKIIFPYYYDENNIRCSYTELEFTEKFSSAANYLQSNYEELKQRSTKAPWFEYGRSQGLKYLFEEKLLISMIMSNNLNVYRIDPMILPFSGYFIVSKGVLSLEFAAYILKSEEFKEYLNLVAINVNGKSLRYSVNDIKNFSLDEKMLKGFKNWHGKYHV